MAERWCCIWSRVQIDLYVPWHYTYLIKANCRHLHTVRLLQAAGTTDCPVLKCTLCYTIVWFLQRYFFIPLLILLICGDVTVKLYDCYSYTYIVWCVTGHRHCGCVHVRDRVWMLVFALTIWGKSTVGDIFAKHCSAEFIANNLRLKMFNFFFHR